MKNQYELLISFRTPDGFKICGKYFLGDNGLFANQVFDSLKGRPAADSRSVLHLDLIETSDGIPVKVRSLGCKLSELCMNCQYITRELFRVQAIEPQPIRTSND